MTETEQKQIFDDWLNQHKALIFKITRAYAFTGMDQDDLFQEIIIQVWHSIPAFRRESSVNTWLYRISLNTAIKWTKKERKHYQSEALEGVQHILQEGRIQTDERLMWLYEEIYKLDEIDRSISLLLLDIPSEILIIISPKRLPPSSKKNAPLPFLFILNFISCMKISYACIIIDSNLRAIADPGCLRYSNC